MARNGKVVHMAVWCDALGRWSNKLAGAIFFAQFCAMFNPLKNTAMEKFSNEEIEMEIGRMPEVLSTASPTAPAGFWLDDDSVISGMTFTTSSHTRPTKP